MNNLDLIIKAIKLRKPITFEYNKPNKVHGLRKGNPHAIYILTPKNSRNKQSTKLDLVQTSGVSDSKDKKPFPDFRRFNIMELSNVIVIEDDPCFEPMLEKYDEEKGEMKRMYNPESDLYKDVIAKV